MNINFESGSEFLLFYIAFMMTLGFFLKVFQLVKEGKLFK